MTTATTTTTTTTTTAAATTTTATATTTTTATTTSPTSKRWSRFFVAYCILIGFVVHDIYRSGRRQLSLDMAKPISSAGTTFAPSPALASDLTLFPSGRVDCDIKCQNKQHLLSEKAPLTTTHPPSEKLETLPPTSSLSAVRQQGLELLQAKQQQLPLQLQHQVPQPHPEQELGKSGEQRILMVTYVFGNVAAEKRYLHMFAESARFSGIDVLIVGDFVPPFFFERDNNDSWSLPNNVLHLLVSWDDLIDRLERNVLLCNEANASGKALDGLRKTKDYYKVIDYKPLFATLFPEQVATYDWWGHLDNDMILGDVRYILSLTSAKLRNQENNSELTLLQDFDIIGGRETEFSWGPFTLYRNSPLINGLFRYAERPLEKIFGDPQAYFFDEWGGGINRNGGGFYTSTMSGIIDKYRQQLGIRWYGGIPYGWDGIFTEPIEAECSCNECHLIRQTSRTYKDNNVRITIPEDEYDERDQQQLLQLPRQLDPQYTQQRLFKYCSGHHTCGKHVALCHFQHSKAVMEASLANLASTTADDHDSSLNSFWNTGRLRVNFLEGFVSLPNLNEVENEHNDCNHNNNISISQAY